jgi:hypothetical protein
MPPKRQIGARQARIGLSQPARQGQRSRQSYWKDRDQGDAWWVRGWLEGSCGGSISWLRTHPCRKFHVEHSRMRLRYDRKDNRTAKRCKEKMGEPSKWAIVPRGTGGREWERLTAENAEKMQRKKKKPWIHGNVSSVLLANLGETSASLAPPFFLCALCVLRGESLSLLTDTA